MFNPSYCGFSTTNTNGFICANCGNWVAYNTFHTCQPFELPDTNIKVDDLAEISRKLDEILKLLEEQNDQP